jgi:hypothetical protein
VAITSAKERTISYTPPAPYDDETWILRPSTNEVSVEIYNRSMVMKPNPDTGKIELLFDQNIGRDETMKYLVMNWKNVGWEYDDDRVDPNLACNQDNKLMVLQKRSTDFWLGIQRACDAGARYTVEKVMEERESFLGTSKPATTTKMPTVGSAPISTEPAT